MSSASVVKKTMTVEPKIRQHDVARGEILRMLVSFKGLWMKARTLLHALDDIGVSFSPDDLAFHLDYLAEGGYLEVQRRRDEPGWRTDRPRPRGESPEDIVLVRLTNRGLWLYDGKVDPDPGVRF